MSATIRYTNPQSIRPAQQRADAREDGVHVQQTVVVPMFAADVLLVHGAHHVSVVRHQQHRRDATTVKYIRVVERRAGELRLFVHANARIRDVRGTREQRVRHISVLRGGRSNAQERRVASKVPVADMRSLEPRRVEVGCNFVHWHVPALAANTSHAVIADVYDVYGVVAVKQASRVESPSSLAPPRRRRCPAPSRARCDLVPQSTA